MKSREFRNEVIEIENNAFKSLLDCLKTYLKKNGGNMALKPAGLGFIKENSIVTLCYNENTDSVVLKENNSDTPYIVDEEVTLDELIKIIDIIE